MNWASLLNDPAYIVRNDPKGMYDLTVAFPSQCQRALEIARASSLPKGNTKPDLVMLTGLGGSAAGGDFVRGLMEAYGTVPFAVNRDYTLPSYVNNATLILATSYSGNTEETLAAYADAKRRGASIVCVTSGGKLAELARQDGFPLILIPGGQPPRTALGFMLMPVVWACEQFGLIPPQDYDALIAHLSSCVSQWSTDVPSESNPTKQLAGALQGKLSVIYGLGGWQALVANRWKGQINENAKNMTFSAAFPELNHNEILGWVKVNQQASNWHGVLLQDGTESAKMQKRFEVTSRLVQDVCQFTSVTAAGNSLLEKMVSLALYGDFVSLYLAALNDVDPENIDSINILKTELSSVP